MKKILLLAAAGIVLMCCLSLCSHKYETVAGDPLNTKIYTLDNGLKVYMSVNKEKPRIQTYIAVRVGGKNDPADNTGLAHYLEHIMFKGTQSVGTMDYEAEKPMLEEIRQLFDVYGKTSDPAQREALYHRIDSISYEASKLAIPNEYDKMMALIGSEGSNAFTSNDVTCYQEDIPSNQIENWARVQADRFKNMVVRGFHTELEAVYEEKNMGLVNDTEKAWETLYASLFKKHPYGTQTVIGTQNHLKNPSISAIINQKNTYYVPNNCAICLSGDFDPDNMVAVIEKYFGDWEPNPQIPQLTYEKEDTLTSPVKNDVMGNDSEFVLIGWRIPGAAERGSEVAELASSLLYNGQAGLIDLNVIQQQKLNGAICFPDIMADYGVLLLGGYPKEGQALEEVEAVLVQEIDRLRRGEFDESLLTGVANNIKLDKMRELQNNSSRAMLYVDSFINGTSWADEVGKTDRLCSLTKEDVTAWAKEYLGDGYAVVYKHFGEDTSIKKIDAPKITPIVTNRDERSAFLTEIQESVPAPIEPVFTDYSKDMSVLSYKGLEVLYKQNTVNDIAVLTFSYDYGAISDPSLSIATDYLSYLGTPTRSAEEIASQMYGLACSFDFSTYDSSTEITIHGLSENISTATGIVEDLLYNATGDNEILEGLKGDIVKSRADAKLNQRACSRALNDYVVYGPEYIRRTTLSNPALLSLDGNKLLSNLKELALKEHSILYYGPMTEDQLFALLDSCHKVAEAPEHLEKVYASMLQTPEPKVFIAPYKARQFNYIQYSNRGEGFDPTQKTAITLFNEYFGGGMNSVVFQEMREARALAYSAGAYLSTPSHLGGTTSFRATIASQNDKLEKAVAGFDEIINDMPRSQKALQIALTSLDNYYRTLRRTGADVLYRYRADKELGLDEPLDKRIFNELSSLGMEDLEAVVSKWIAGRTYVYGIVGDTSDIDLAFCRKKGPVKVLTLEEVFGY